MSNKLTDEKIDRINSMLLSVEVKRKSCQEKLDAFNENAYIMLIDDPRALNDLVYIVGVLSNTFNTTLDLSKNNLDELLLSTGDGCSERFLTSIDYCTTSTENTLDMFISNENLRINRMVSINPR